jgi:hypothetical protein
VLIEEHLDLLLVDVAHLLRGHGNGVSVLVATVCGKFVDIVNGGYVVVDNSEFGEVIDGYFATRVMELALVDALGRLSVQFGGGVGGGCVLHRCRTRMLSLW